MTATVYQRITSTLQNLHNKHAEATDPTVVSYMIARWALLQVRGHRGAHRAAEMAYKLADEFAGEKPSR